MSTYKVRVINCDFWNIDDEEIIYNSLEEAEEDIAEFLEDTAEADMDYTRDDIEIVEVSK
jgi:hypothetical protein